MLSRWIIGIIEMNCMRRKINAQFFLQKCIYMLKSLLKKSKGKLPTEPNQNSSVTHFRVTACQLENPAGEALKQQELSFPRHG